MFDFLMAIRDALVAWLAQGLWVVPWWWKVIYTMVATHITIVSVTIFLHRAQAHRALTLHPAVAHIFRFWLWVSTGMVTKEFVAVHRKHHAKCETKDDPHSPQIYGIRRLLLEGVELYREATKTMPLRPYIPSNRSVPEKTLTELEHYGSGTPDDWFERNVYSVLWWQGVGLMLIIDLLLFGAIGAVIWAIQMVWIPWWATGVINGLGHYWGYRNFSPIPDDMSTNVSPWGILIGGEELHNNHHTYPSSAKFSVKPYEFDIGWVYIRGLELLGLAQVKKTVPTLELDPAKVVCDAETVTAVIALRHQIVARLNRTMKRYTDYDRRRVMQDMRDRLCVVWENAKLSRDQMVVILNMWCRDAKRSGIPGLCELARTLPGYRVG